MSSTTLRAARWVLPPALVAAAVMIPQSARGDDSFDAVRAATDRFHSVEQADRADYVNNELPCFDSSDGGMGEHLINGALIGDGELNPLEPEALVYEVGPRGVLRLVGVEYIAPRTDANPPSLFGRNFEPATVGGMDLWTLHAWVWRSNPTDDFAAFNPAVRSCP